MSDLYVHVTTVSGARYVINTDGILIGTTSGVSANRGFPNRTWHLDSEVKIGYGLRFYGDSQAILSTEVERVQLLKVDHPTGPACWDYVYTMAAVHIYN
jgi:hypothetical protein